MTSILALFAIGLVILVSSAYLYYKWEWKSVAILVPVIIFFITYSSGVRDFPIFATSFLLGGIGGYTFKKTKSLKFFILASSLSLTIIFLGVFYYLFIYENVDFIGILRSEMSKFLELANTPEDIKKQLLIDFDNSKGDLLNKLPFSSFLNSLIMSGLGFIIIKKFFSRFIDTSAVKGLEFFRLNEYIIFLLIGGWTAYLLIDKTDYYIVNTAGFNIALIVSVLYFIQALGVIKFLLIKRGIPTYLLPIFIFIILIIGIWAVFFIFILLTGFGALDFWADFRKLSKKEDKIEKI